MDTPAKTAEDIIGIVPHTLGYTPVGSLVAITVVTGTDGIRSCAMTLRVDFDPEIAAKTLVEGGDWLRELVCRAGVPSGVFLVVYDDEGTGGNGDGAAAGADRCDEESVRMRRDLVRAATDEFATALGAAGIDTLGAWWVGDGRFGRIDDSWDPGTDLRSAETSACATELVSTGSAPAAAPGDCVVRPAAAEERAAHLGGEGDCELTVAESFDVLTEIYADLLRLREGPEAIDRQRLEELMGPRTVFALDRILAHKWSRDALEMLLSFDHPDFPPRRVRRFGPGDLVDRARRAGASRRSAEQMIGLSRRAPRPRDVLLAIAFLETYVRWSRPARLATVYGVIAWFHWSLGGATMAEQYALAALAIDPDHAMADLILSAVAHGYLPGWLAPKRAARGRV